MTRRRPGRPPGTPQGRETARERYYRAQAERAELENQRKQGKLIDRAAENRRDFTIARTLRDRLLLLPRQLAGELAAMDSDPGRIELRLETGIRDCLEVLADTLETEGEP